MSDLTPNKFAFIIENMVKEKVAYEAQNLNMLKEKVAKLPL